MLMNKEEQKEVEADMERGYISKDQVPLRCRKCGSKELEDCNHDYFDGHTLMEYDVKCKKCKTIAGTWAHGSWFL